MAYKRKFSKVSKSTSKPKRTFRSKSKRTFTRKRSFASRVKAVVLKTSESKEKNYVHDKTELYHNVWATLSMNRGAGQNPPQGSSDSQRVGDKIFVGGYMLRMLIGQKVDRPNVNFRWAIIESPKNAAFVRNEWLTNVTGNNLLDPWNKDWVRVVKSGVWRPNQAALATAGDREFTFTKKIWLPYRHQFVFGPGDGETVNMVSPTRDLTFMICAYDAYGSLITDNISYIQIAQTLYYKDV